MEELTYDDILKLSSPLQGREKLSGETFDCRVIVPVETFEALQYITKPGKGLSISKKDQEVKQILADVVRSREVFYWSTTIGEYYPVTEIISVKVGKIKIKIGNVIKSIHPWDICPNIQIDNWRKYGIRQITEYRSNYPLNPLD